MQMCSKIRDLCARQNSVVDHLSSMHKTLGSIPGAPREQNKKSPLVLLDASGEEPSAGSPSFISAELQTGLKGKVITTQNKVDRLHLG